MAERAAEESLEAHPLHSIASLSDRCYAKGAMGSAIPTKDKILTALAGFGLTLGIFFIATYLQAGVLQSQLLAGDPELNKHYPTTYNVLSQSETLKVASLALTSVVWWAAVTIIGFFVTWLLLRWRRWS